MRAYSTVVAFEAPTAWRYEHSPHLVPIHIPIVGLGSELYNTKRDENTGTWADIKLRFLPRTWYVYVGTRALNN